MRLDALIRQARTALADANLDSPDLDARLIVEHFSGTTRSDAISQPEKPVALEIVKAIEAALARRIAGKPVHRIIGHREFYGLKLKLSPGTLEPRPDTEALVEAVLPHVRATARETGSCHILDLGTGTGAIALALLSQAPQARATGVDMSADALAMAVENAQALGLSDRFEAVQSDWFDKISGTYDAIVSNPPYIRSKDIASLSKEVREHDPWAALDGGDDGLVAYRAIAEGCGQHMSPNGIIAVEIGYDQRQEVAELFAGLGFEIDGFHRDLGGRDRVIVFKRRK